MISAETFVKIMGLICEYGQARQDMGSFNYSDLQYGDALDKAKTTFENITNELYKHMRGGE